MFLNLGIVKKTDVHNISKIYRWTISFENLQKM